MGLVLAGICAVLLCGLIAGTAYWEARHESKLTPRQRSNLFLTAAFFAFIPMAVLCAAAVTVVFVSGYCEESYEESCVSDSLWLLSLPLLAGAVPFAYLANKSARAARRQ
jgi:hypothetical protein